MKHKKAILAVALVAALIIGATATTFYFHWIQTPYFPSEYSWQAPWEVKAKVDFVEATLTLTGSSYESDPHDVELVIKNVATEPNYVVLSMDYQAVWTVGADSEVIIGGTYSGALIVGENVSYTSVFTPALIGIGNVEMSITNIAWVESQPIAWTTEIVSLEPNEVTDFIIIGATRTHEAGTVTFTITQTTHPTIKIDYKVEIVGVTVIADVLDTVFANGVPQTFTFDIDPLTVGGAQIMRLTLFKHG